MPWLGAVNEDRPSSRPWPAALRNTSVGTASTSTTNGGNGRLRLRASTAMNRGQSPRRLAWCCRTSIPDDYEQVAATLEDIRRTLKPFSTRHRIITVQGATREVVVIGERMHDNAGQVIGTQGFYIDVTPTGAVQAAIITEAVAEIAENRAAIEQAKGILMLVYRIQFRRCIRLAEVALAGDQRQASRVGRTADSGCAARWNMTKPCRPDRRSTGYCSRRINASGPRPPRENFGATAIRHRREPFRRWCGGAVRRPAWIGGAPLPQEDRQADDGGDRDEVALPVLHRFEPELRRRHDSATPRWLPHRAEAAPR